MNIGHQVILKVIFYIITCLVGWWNLTHPESRKAIDFVNNAKVDDYKRTEFDEMKADTSHTTFDNKEQGPAKMQYKFGNGGN